jgi:hypothetical protein
LPLPVSLLYTHSLPPLRPGQLSDSAVPHVRRAPGRPAAAGAASSPSPEPHSVCEEALRDAGVRKDGDGPDAVAAAGAAGVGSAETAAALLSEMEVQMASLGRMAAAAAVAAGAPGAGGLCGMHRGRAPAPARRGCAPELSGTGVPLLARSVERGEGERTGGGVPEEANGGARTESTGTPSGTTSEDIAAGGSQGEEARAGAAALSEAPYRGGVPEMLAPMPSMLAA